MIFNPLLRAGKTVTFSLSAPIFDGTELCRFSIDGDGPSIHNIISSKAYNKRYNAISSKMRRGYLIDEIPDYGHFKDAFFHSAILTPTGLDVLFGYIEKASLQSVIKGGDVYYIAFDTNVLRDRIYSNYLRRYSDAPNIDFILSATVRSELTNRKGKVNKKMVNQLCEAIGPAGWNLLNQNTLADRLRYIGFLEYNRIRHETDCDQLNPDNTFSDKDREIIQTYAAFATAGHNRKILLISRDNEFIRMSPSLPDVIPVVIESRFPAKISRPIRCGYNELFSFIYHLSLIFLELEITLMGHRLYRTAGAWRGKNVRHWENDFIKVSANRGLPFLKEIGHQINILQNMKYKKVPGRFPRTE
jgi:hypothetical protein